jgi:glycolate oxidase FAD binding subunit
MSEDPGRGTLTRLEGVAGDRAYSLETVERVGGSRLMARVEPKDGEELAACLEVFSSRREPALVMGAGTRMELGNPARGVSIALSCRRLNGIVEFDPADGVIQVLAGTPLAEVARAVEAEGWLLPLDPPDRGGTVGGVLATAACGPRQRGFGSVRDAVLGIDTAMASGARARCGARVVKNVTGYDLAKLYVGSLGTLAVIEKVWLRLKPLPASTRVVEVEMLEAQDAFALAVAATRRSSARAVALVGEGVGEGEGVDQGACVGKDPGEGAGPRAAGGEASDRWRLVAEFAGEEPVTEADAAWLSAGRGGHARGDASVDAVRALQGRRSPEGLKARIHIVPGALAMVCSRLRAGGARVLAYPEPGVVHANFDPGDAREDLGSWFEGTLGLLDEIRAAAAAELIIEALPPDTGTQRDVFAGAPGLALMRSIKERFDPDGILNPGRFAGWI